MGESLKRESVSEFEKRAFENLHDFEYLHGSFEKVCRALSLQCDQFGYMGRFPIMFLRPEEVDTRQQNRLIAGGIHGDEPAGPWAILQYLEACAAGDGLRMNESFLPVLNPSGFILKNRENAYAQDPNRGFCTPWNEMQDLSREGELLLEHSDILKKAATHGFLTLHENWEYKKFYLFMSSRDTPQATELANEMCSIGEEAFGIADNEAPDVDFPEGIAYGGIVTGAEGGAFEDWIFSQTGAPTYTTETPSETNPTPASLAKRIDVNRRIIQLFTDPRACSETLRAPKASKI